MPKKKIRKPFENLLQTRLYPSAQNVKMRRDGYFLKNLFKSPLKLCWGQRGGRESPKTQGNGREPWLRKTYQVQAQQQEARSVQFINKLLVRLGRHGGVMSSAGIRKQLQEPACDRDGEQQQHNICALLTGTPGHATFQGYPRGGFCLPGKQHPGPKERIQAPARDTYEWEENHCLPASVFLLLIGPGGLG